jgi:hypothetical protein
MVSRSSAAGSQVFSCCSISFVNSLILLSSHSSSSIMVICLLKFGHSLLMLNVCDVVEDPLSRFLKAENV